MEYFTKIDDVSKIFSLENKFKNSKFASHVSLFFKSKNYSIDHLLQHENLILFTSNFLVSAGNLENITSKFTEKSYEDFVSMIEE